MEPGQPPTPGHAVITGYGAVSCHGSGVETLWAALASKTPAGSAYTPDDSAPGDEYFAAVVAEGYRPHPDIPRNLVHFLDRGSLIALDAALQAVAAAGLSAGAGDARRFAVADGLAFRAPGQATLFVPYGHQVARALGVRGPVLAIGGAESSGLGAIALAARLVAQGTADTVIAGAAQALQAPVLEHLQGRDLLSNRPARPFDEAHDGMVPAEGAAYVVVEREETAQQRGSKPVATVVGAGEVFDPTSEPLATSDASEAGRAMQAALGDAGYLQNQVDLVISCADGRQDVDFAEGYGLRQTFGRHAYYAGVSAIAGTTGQALAASGPLSVVAALEAMNRQATPPLAGFERHEQDLELAYVRDEREERLDCVLVTSLGIGGTNVSLVLERAK